MMRLDELARRVGGTLRGDGEQWITGVAGIRDAGAGEMTFLGHRRYESFLATTKASAVILDATTAEGERSIPPGIAVVEHENPYLAFQSAMRILYGDRYRPAPGIHATAIVAKSASIGEEVSIGPHVVIESGAKIGDRVVLRAGAYVGADVHIGDDTELFPHVVIRERVRIGARNVLHAGAVIGDDGFGLVKDEGHNQSIPQIGTVVLGDDVEIGSNSCVDRATIGETRIDNGTRIDNLVQIGHNVQIGKNSIFCAQVGIAGSTQVGDRVVVGGQAGITGHIRIENGAQIAAQTGVVGNIGEGERVSGYPARPHGEQLRQLAAARRLPDLLRRIDQLERRLAALEPPSTSTSTNGYPAARERHKQAITAPRSHGS